MEEAGEHTNGGIDKEGGEATQRLELGDVVPPIAITEDELAAGVVVDENGALAAERQQDAGADADENRREIEALYGTELKKTKDKVVRWRAKQVKEAFQTGDQWADLIGRLSEKELTAFLASECQVPRRDVARYLRLAQTFKEEEEREERELFVKHGVAVSVLLDLAAQDETVRAEAIKMIEAGRSLQAKELRGLKRDVGLARAATEGKPDESRIRDIKNTAARKARGAAVAWLSSLEALTNEVIALTEFDRSNSVADNAMDRVSKLAEDADRLLADLPVIVGEEFLTQAGPVAEQPGRGSWHKVGAALRRIAQRDVFFEEHFRRPMTTLLSFNPGLMWTLAWVFGYDDDDSSEIARRMREAGQAPLDTSAQSGRVRAEVSRSPTVLEICAGAGGEALGLEAAGFHHLGLVEMDDDAVATLQNNRPKWPVIHANLRGLDLRAYKGLDLLAGGVPCQPYSTAGEGAGDQDERDLFPEALRLIRQLKPKAIMLENVTGLLHAPNTVNRLRILSEVTRLGYDAEWRIVEGIKFGLPQNRRRAILVGFQPGIMHRFRWPKELETKAPFVGEALRDLMAAEGWPHVDAWVQKAKGYAPTLIGGSQKKMGIDLAQEKSRESWTKIGVNPSGRAKTAPGPDAPADHMPRLTLKMMARIQDFPNDWAFQGNDLQAFHQIANAFPPCMAHAVAASIMRALTGSEIDLPTALAAPRPGKASRKLDLASLRASAALRERARLEDVEEMA